MSDATKSFKYLSAFTLSDIRNIIVDVKLNPLMVILSIVITTIFVMITIRRYKSKELV